VKLSSESKKYLGSIISINSENNTKIYASGFRNPQGFTLYEDATGFEILQTGHGPRGGDELNIVKEGAFYGWPEFSYGTRYNPINPLSKPENPNTAGTSEKPLFAWVPSIGISSVTQVKSATLRKLWADASTPEFGDALVAGMNSGTIYRLRIVEKRVIYSEPIYIGVRVRAISEEKSGRIVLGTDTGVHVLDLQRRWDIPKGTFVPAN
jgi:glucose/arabinose dehydrogenase